MSIYVMRINLQWGYTDYMIPMDRFLLETDAPYFIPQGALKNSMNCSFPRHVIYTDEDR